ncbi:hypothetical protein EFM62_05075 [Enterococcus faecium]|nr:hypothetical protein [Enterococcus faecium]
MFLCHNKKKTVTKVLSQPLILNKWCSRDSLSAIRHDFVKYGKLFFNITSYRSCRYSSQFFC